MSTIRGVDIQCDVCGHSVEGTVCARGGVRRARARAKKRGWIYIRNPDRPSDMIDLCPRCHPHEQEEAEIHQI